MNCALYIEHFIRWIWMAYFFVNFVKNISLQSVNNFTEIYYDDY